VHTGLSIYFRKRKALIASSSHWECLHGGRTNTISDPHAKIKQKLQEEIEQLSHEFNVELPKEIAIARAQAIARKMPSTSTPESARAMSISKSRT